MIKIEDKPLLTLKKHTDKEKDLLGLKFGLFNHTSVYHNSYRNKDQSFWFFNTGIATASFSKYKELYALTYLTYCPEFNEVQYSPLLNKIVGKILINNPQYSDAYSAEQNFLLYMHVPLMASKLMDGINSAGKEVEYMNEKNLIPYMADEILEDTTFQRYMKQYQFADKILNTSSK